MKKNNNITCRVFFIFGLIFLSQSALAQKIEPEGGVCFAPASGHQIILETADSTCPEGHQRLLVYEVRKTPADAPSPEPRPQQQENTGGQDAPPHE